jgi:hypothetical protein
VPRWPTFAIDLLAIPPYRDPAESRVWMPNENGEGGEERWTIWEGRPAPNQVLGFAGAIFRAAQNWLDNRQMRVQGPRPGSAHVYLDQHEGGMNLDARALARPRRGLRRGRAAPGARLADHGADVDPRAR